MAATDKPVGAILAAALALPGLLPAVAQAENAPEHASLAFKHLYYRDYQKDLTRITVNAPSINAEVPLGDHWGVQASAVLDSVSGASPRYWTTSSGASKMDDKRVASDVKITHYRERSAYAVSYSHSDEHDYVSDAVSGELRLSSDDNNTTLNLGAGYSSDKINPTNDIVENETKRTAQFIAGITQAWSPKDLVQLELGYTAGKGYYNDPYKLFDNRPDHRDTNTVAVRWNHYVETLPASLKTSYRYYRDSYGIRAHTLGLEWAQPISEHVTWTPSLRYDTQNAARFYIDPSAESTFPSLPDGAYSSLDQRLAAFGGITTGQKLSWRAGRNWTLDARVEYSEQRASWRISGDGSPGLDPFSYVSVQAGIAYRF